MPSVLITGASRGLGLEFTRQYLADGWQVLAGARNAEDLTRAHLDARPKQLSVLTLDVADTASVKRAAAGLKGTPIDVLLNCAGVFGGKQQRLGSLDYEDWRQVLDVNLFGPARVCEAFLEAVAKSARRLMITITSGMGSLADNSSGGYIAYRTSKAAVNMLMRTAAIDLRSRGVTSVVVNPGWVKTDMGGPGAKLSPQESIAAMRQLFARLGPADSGRFFNYDGREYPW
ncbi:MAG: SDR family oxidoreductase [Gammaproteobacteria bacterium]|nr:SDR family oxidoreductase [Gammaproteobacteria bacterium]